MTLRESADADPLITSELIEDGPDTERDPIEALPIIFASWIENDPSACRLLTLGLSHGFMPGISSSFRLIYYTAPESLRRPIALMSLNQLLQQSPLIVKPWFNGEVYNMLVDNKLTVSGASVVAGFEVTGDLKVDGKSELVGDVKADGKSEFVGDVKLDAALSVISNASVGGQLTASGLLAVGGKLTIATQPTYTAYCNSLLTVVSGDPTKINVWGTVVTNVGSDITIVSSRDFKFNATGRYLVTANIIWGSFALPAKVEALICINDNISAETRLMQMVTPVASGVVGYSGAAIYDATSGDYINVLLTQDSGADVGSGKLSGSEACRMSITRLA